MSWAASAGRRFAPPEPRLARGELGDPRADRVERLARGQSVDRADAKVGLVLLEQAGDAHHEELVEIRGDDRDELHPLEKRERRVLGELEQPCVELDPRELTVDQSRRRSLGLDGHLASVGAWAVTSGDGWW